MSTNASDHQVRRAVAVAFIKRLAQLVTSGASLKDAVHQVFVKHSELIERCIFDKANSSKTDQVDFMLMLQSELSHRERGDTMLLSVATKLIEMDLVEEEGMMQWWGDSKAVEGEDMKKVRAKTQELIDFLEQSDEESDEDEDESEEESD